MKLNELLAGIDVLEAGTDLSMEIAGVSYDSRLTKPGDLFVAIAGYETDGPPVHPHGPGEGGGGLLLHPSAPGDP